MKLTGWEEGVDGDHGLAAYTHVPVGCEISLASSRSARNAQTPAGGKEQT